MRTLLLALLAAGVFLQLSKAIPAQDRLPQPTGKAAKPVQMRRANNARRTIQPRQTAPSPRAAAANYAVAQEPSRPPIAEPPVERLPYDEFSDRGPWQGDLYEPGYSSLGPGADCCHDGCGPNTCCHQPLAPYGSGQFVAGFAFTFLKPQFGDNIAFTQSTSDGANFEDIAPQQFDYSLETSPRVWLEYLGGDDLGARVRYWQFNHNPDTITASPAANGFGRLTAPPFGNIDLSTTIPGEEMTASSSLELHALDLEGVKVTNFGPWGLAASAGVRYGNFQQGYLNQLHDVNGALEGQIDFQHNFDGVGPTFALEARRWLPGRFSVFSSARGALLFGNRRSTLTAGEDLDLSTPFITTENNSRYDTIPVAEMQLGLDWHTPFCHFATLFLQVAMEAQWWQDIGTAATEEGNLGLFGFNTAVGLIW